MAKHGYKMTPKGIGGQAYPMMGGQNLKKKKTKMVDLVPRDKSGKPIPQVRGGAGLLGFVGGNAFSAIKQGLSAGKKLFKAFSSAPKQYTGRGGSNIKSAIKQIKSTKIGKSVGQTSKAFSNTPKQLYSKSIRPKTTREKVTGLSEDFFKRVAKNNPGAKSRTSGVHPFIQGSGRIKDPLKRFK
jgi:hypothetical protein